MIDYKSSGVDIDAGNEVVQRVKRLARSTFTPSVLSDVGSFGGLFQLDLNGLDEPVLVASADGVGTKLKVGFLTGRHDTVGADLVNHCVNDILVQGAKPLFFLDYLATGRLSLDVSASVIEGVAAGCRDNQCALLGGETAEMPGFYADGEYDLAGFIVGMVGRSDLIDGREIEPGDLLLGLPSAGLHTNGFSLARQIMFDIAGLSVESTVDDIEPGATVGEVLLRPHRSYLGALAPLLGADVRIVKGLVHITGGGLTDNVPRVLPEGTGVTIDRGTWAVPPLFRFLKEAGQVSDGDMFRTFNMGIGMVVVCAPAALDDVRERLSGVGETGSMVIGRVIKGKRTVEYA